MEFREVVRRRRMVRRYDPNRAVDPALIDRMLEHATHAPSAGFSQGWAFLRLDTPEAVAEFWRATSPDPASANRWLDGMRTAPVVIVPMSNKGAYLERYAEPDKSSSDRASSGRGGPRGEGSLGDGSGGDGYRWPIPYWHTDVAMASLLILQTVVDEGLGACFFGIPGDRVADFREAFGVPAAYTPVGAITVGHRLPDTGAAGSPARRQRKALDQVVHRGRWQS
jgi:nitroreductase